MKEFNRHIKNGNTFKKIYLGATPQELHHYIAKPLEDEHPDSAILHIGTNSIASDDVNTIVNNVVRCVNRCREYGVNNVFVSQLTYRPGHEKKINEVNDLLCTNQFIHDFSIIDNSNISAYHVWRDNLHLNNEGRDILANNIIDAVNRAHATRH